MKDYYGILFILCMIMMTIGFYCESVRYQLLGATLSILFAIASREKDN